MKQNYSNPAIEELFRRFPDDQARDWVRFAINCFTENFPNADHYHTGGLNFKYIDLRIGIRPEDSTRGKPYFRLYRHNSTVRLCANKTSIRDSLLPAPGVRCINSGNTDFNGIKSWIDTIQANLNGASIQINGSGWVPNSYSRHADVEEPDEMDEPSEASTTWLKQVESLNQILFGPPGTGKTYHSVNLALNICDLELNQIKSDNRHEKRLLQKKRFDELVQQQRVRFVTFHQSFSYEDFVEGIRAHIDEISGQIKYSVEPGIFKQICIDARKDHQPYVLIIDEINRGNVSRIFGELITLIEESKREGSSEALSVKLPYSKELFSVPKNVFLVGTMNTTDRSLAGLDIALRRRFVFHEMQPNPALLEHLYIEDINIGQLLRVMNQRIEVLLDRDHCIGHAYFMPLTTVEEQGSHLLRLESIFRNQIIPLLQEYFFEDWERIRWVLNDQNSEANGTQAFIIRPHSEININILFGEKVAKNLSERRWYLNEEAFKLKNSYLNILTPST